MQHMHTDNMHMLAPRTGLFLLFCLEFVTAFSAWVPPVGYVPQSRRFTVNELPNLHDLHKKPEWPSVLSNATTVAYATIVQELKHENEKLRVKIVDQKTHIKNLTSELQFCELQTQVHEHWQKELQEAHWVTANGKKALLMIYTVHF